MLLRSVCARTEENIEAVNDFDLSQENKPQTHGTVRQISREMGIHWSSLSQIICEDLPLKCLKWCRAQELTDANCAACMKRAKLLLQNFPQYEKMFLVASSDNRQNKVSGRLQELLKKRLSVFFSASTAQSATAWPPVNCACVPQLLQQLINTTLYPAFLR